MNRRERRKAIRDGKLPSEPSSTKEEVFETSDGRRYIRMKNGEIRRVAQWRKPRNRKANNGLHA